MRPAKIQKRIRAAKVLRLLWLLAVASHAPRLIFFAKEASCISKF
jgi:hypothetical protein